MHVEKLCSSPLTACPSILNFKPIENIIKKRKKERKESVKFHGDMLFFCDFILVFVLTTNHHLEGQRITPDQFTSFYNFISFLFAFLRRESRNKEQSIAN